MRELSGEIRNRLRINLALVTLLKHREIGAAGLPVLAVLPSMDREVLCGRRQHVWPTVQMIAPAVAIKINGIFDPG